MTFGQSISTCFSKYATFSGRASRSEYWFWYLFTCLVSFTAGLIDGMLEMQALALVASLALLIPSLAVSVRRMHDTNHSGWFLLIPIYNFILTLLASDANANKYGSVQH